MSNSNQPPVRRRQIATTSAAENKAAVIANLATEYYVANQKSNAEKRRADGLRKKLLGAMQDSKCAHREIIATIDGKEQPLLIDVETPQRVVIDVEKLAKLITVEQLLQVVSATQASVKETLGSHILPQVSTEVEGTTNVSVSVPKAGA